MKKTFIGVYHFRDQLFSKIKELQQRGVHAEDIYIVAKDQVVVEELKSVTSQHIQDSPSSMVKRFFGFLTGEDNVRSMLGEVGFSKAEADLYFKQVMNGAMLIYIEGPPLDDPPMSALVVGDDGYRAYEPVQIEDSKVSGLEGE
ncbi:general stress protein [Sporosarcina saromensis]|uniref:General stress protein n=1 Tax=Sporosarcina saromensis TaxID=359365 RepID=A0ABU4G6E6_9BACL|nr:general stress protein [Sporosarcina saromensis]MDW0112481.1 general stress protein [Sporosarcina saromensis]